MLVSLVENTRVVAAATLERKENYTCPVCGAAVVLKAGTMKIPHFAHKVKCDCDNAGETIDHEHTKLGVWKWLNDNGHSAHMEVDLRSKGINRRADVLGVINNQPVAIEIQHSYIEAHVIHARTADYTSIGLPVIWIYVGDKFSSDMPAHFQRMHGGVLFTSSPLFNGLIHPVRLDRKQVWVEPTDFYIEGGRGEMGSAGGFHKTLKKQKQVTAKPELLRLDQITFHTNRNEQLVGYMPYEMRWFK